MKGYFAYLGNLLLELSHKPRVRRALGDDSAILLPGHGIVTVGETVEQACMLTASLNEQARKLFHASLLGKVPRDYVELLITPQKASIESDSWRWYESK